MLLNTVYFHLGFIPFDLTGSPGSLKAKKHEEIQYLLIEGSTMARASSKLNQLQTKHLKQHNSPYTLLGKNISPPKVCLKMTFHFPRLGYVSSLEGTLIGSISTSGSIMVNPYPQAAQLPGVTSALRVTLCHGQSFRVFCGAHKSSPNKNPQGIPVFLFLSLFSLVFWKFFLGSNVKVLLEGFGLCG